MPANSLIFAIILAIWAVYLLQHWARRREQAAATRSVDGFTETMRVLERRPSWPSTDLSPPRPHSYMLALGRGARPTVEVKRARPAGLHATPRPARYAQTRPDPATEVAPMRQPTSSQTPRSFTLSGLSPQRSRQVRGIALLIALAWVPLSIVLAAFSVIGWVTVPFAFVLLGAVVFWLKTEAEAERAAKRPNGTDESRTARPSARRPSTRPARRPAAPTMTSEETQEISAERLESARRERPAPRRSTRADATTSRPVQEDIDDEQQSVPAAAGSTASDAAVPQPSVEPAPGTWTPVEVPRPTYTMKAMAPAPRLTDQGIPADVFDTPEFADEADELDERALYARRAANG